MTEPGSRPRPGGRSARVRRAVLDATLDLLHLHGMDGLTVAEVSTRAGVHETSIYRRWGTRENLMIDALLEEAEELLPIPDTGSLRDDLIAYLTSLAAYLSTPQGNAFDRALAAAGDDPAASQARKQYWDTRHTRSGEIITRGIDRGELPGTTDPRLAVEMLVAPLHFKVVLSREPLDPGLPTRLVDALLRGIVADEDTSGRDTDG
ncbi:MULTISPECIES: TetR/AcrR family transcriptional regulator [unclassified Rhodococcus (in: high G+C Gram-positive bacteria)]|uniref:TetR/AcrR family transcriptional regulator n=1 Tax=unclassified Rhodococcus (in: high G+C Gram-positive bacteria) TaxID=192944 RepID=UPI00163A9C17|nr:MULTISPECIES: TetR/AcrR family transcriptional regulator [unclassified Rhodococcus (in: high G+C Gram-positive bacteria)]MBC2642028.1 TetR/AcrR family transcriptional regulator [Rhodococcus sp. 3A]MBC2893230.1 TetR/AcrR family transcriptional regulator [Rhodococcus sp. 4CII]